jgi:hypothetical protein
MVGGPIMASKLGHQPVPVFDGLTGGTVLRIPESCGFGSRARELSKRARMKGLELVLLSKQQMRKLNEK